MKNNRMLIVLAVIVFLLLGWYQIFNEPAQKAQKYQEALQTARGYMEEESYEYAVEAYEDVKKIQDSLELWVESSEAYRACMEADSPRYGELQYRRYLEKISENYPTEPKGYELLFDYYYEQGQMQKCLVVLTDANGRKAESNLLREDYEKIRYAAELDMTRYNDYMPYCGGAWMVLAGEGWCYIDDDESKIISASYDYAAPFGNNTAYVVSGDVAKLIDGTGSTIKIVSEIYVETGFFAEGLMPVCVGSAYYYVNEDLEYVMGPYGYAGSFSSGVAAVKEDGAWSIIDPKGNVIAKELRDVKLDKLGRCAPAGMIVADDGSGYRLFDLEMKAHGDSWEDADVYLGGDIAVCDGSHWGYIDSTGAQVIECGFTEARSFSGGVAAVQREGLWGFINPRAEMVIENVYEDAAYFDPEGLGFVMKDGYWHSIAFVCDNVDSEGGLFA